MAELIRRAVGRRRVAASRRTRRNSNSRLGTESRSYYMSRNQAIKKGYPSDSAAYGDPGVISEGLKLSSAKPKNLCKLISRHDSFIT